MTERLANLETVVEFVKKYTPCINGETTMECVERSIRNAPTIEAKPIVHAHWKDCEDPRNAFCTHCGLVIEKQTAPVYRYCRACGAQMDESTSCGHEDDKAVKIPVISMEDVPKLMKEMEK